MLMMARRPKLIRPGLFKMPGRRLGTPPRISRFPIRFIDRHAEVSPGVFLTQYDDGTKVYVNYNKEAASIDGTTIPAEDWRLVLTEKK